MTDVAAAAQQTLRDCRTVAVVGLSANPVRPSHYVARYLQENGYRIIPVNPGHHELLGLKCYPDLKAIPEPVDVVEVFRRSEDVEPIARDAVAIGAKVLWMQMGVVNERARTIAEDGGLTVIMDRCMKIEHSRLTAPAR